MKKPFHGFRTKIMMIITTEATSTLRLTQKVKRHKLVALYRFLNVTGNLDLINFGRLKLTTDSKI